MHVFSCSACRTAWFPVKLRCARCGGRQFESTPVVEVDVEEVTVDPRRGVWLATVRTAAGARLIARVPVGTSTGGRLPVVDSVSAVVDGHGAFAG